MLWSPLERGHGLILREQVGLPPDVASTLARWPAGSLPDDLARTAGRGHGVASGRVPVEWDGRTLLVVGVPPPVNDVLGVFVTGDVPHTIERAVVALARTYAAAVAQSDAMRDHQRVVDAMVDELRPSDITLPAGCSIGHLYRSATTNVAIGGDLYDWFCSDRGDLIIAIGDVSGKGVQAASRTAMAVHSLRAFALPGTSPHVATTMLNTVVSGRTGTETFVTLIYLRVDTTTFDVDFVVAGHPPPVLARSGGVEVLDVEADLPIGVDASASYTLQHTRLQPGDSLVLYTDGVTEARASHDGALLGTSGLVRMIGSLRHEPAQGIADGLWQGVQDYTAGDTTDDVAVVVLRRE